MNKATCPVCHSTNMTVLSPYRTTSPELEGKQKATCDDCDMVFLTPLPSEQQWDEYNRNYFEKAHGGLAAKQRAKNYHMALAKIRGQHVRNLVEQKKLTINRIFEVGPGNGDFARNWLSINPQTHYSAIETDASLHANLTALGIKLYPAVKEIQADDTAFDLVVISHVLEHTLDPRSFIQAMTAKLKSGGLLFIEVPCQDFKYKSLDEPHILFFDKPAMHKLFSHLEFSEVHTSYHGGKHADLIRKNNQSRPAHILSRIASELAARLPAEKPGSPALTKDEWLAVSSFNAHKTQQTPARWLRVLAIKK